MRQALYRKYRPQNFEQIYGQDNIVNILKNQIINNKISHAYIFSGTRGTGKTSTAKIFAKAVNCISPINGNPCNECINCKAIQEESTMDIVEMDAASNRGVDDIRQIRDQVVYPPTLLKYKVYIIDEAHMITKEGFNALLKMMEEPPRHLIFILATTEIEKIPDTILSRTQRYEFKSLGIENIKSQIKEILQQENIEMEERAIDVIANVASGAMRDALSILDQVISIGKSEISSLDVYDLLGVFSDEIKIKYVKCIFEKDIKNLLLLIDEELNKGKDSNNFIKEMIDFYKDLIYIKIGIKDNFVGTLLENISLDQLINSSDILLEYQEIMQKSDSAGLLFRIASVRLVDYMPRKQLEAKIKNLEERILFLEKNGVRVQNIEEKKHEVVEVESVKISSKKGVEENLIDEIKEETHENQIEKIEGNSNELEHENQKNLESDLEIFINILQKNYGITNLVMNDVKDSRQMLDRLVFFVSEKTIPTTVAMTGLFNKAKEDLKKVIGKEYEIKFEIYKQKGENNKYDEKTLEKIKSIFPKDKLKIKDKK